MCPCVPQRFQRSIFWIIVQIVDGLPIRIADNDEHLRPPVSFDHLVIRTLYDELSAMFLYEPQNAVSVLL